LEGKPAGSIASANPQPSMPVAAASVSLEQELELLDRARNQLVAGKAAAALELLNHYQALHAKSMSSEATLLRIQALEANGRSAEAVALARTFVKANPNSPLADRARRFIPSEIQGQGGRPGALGEQR
jgi:hypothetical protein